MIEADFRKDVAVGTNGVIVDWADDEKRAVNFAITLNIVGQPQTITGRISIRNLQLIKDYKDAPAAQLPPAPVPSSSSTSPGSKQETRKQPSGETNTSLRREGAKQVCLPRLNHASIAPELG